MMLWIKRIKYRKALEQYKLIVEGISNLTIGLLKDIGSPEDFMKYPDSDDLLIVAEIQDLCELIVRYNDNPLAHSSTSLGLSCYQSLVKNFNNLTRMKTEYTINQINVKAINEIPVDEDDDGGNLHKSLVAAGHGVSERLKGSILACHAKILRDLSSIRNSIRLEVIDVRLNNDIIKEHFKGKEKHKKVELKISAVNNTEEVQK